MIARLGPWEIGLWDRGSERVMSREVVRTSVTDPNGKVTTYAFDDADRLLSVTDAANNVWSEW